MVTGWPNRRFHRPLFRHDGPAWQFHAPDAIHSIFDQSKTETHHRTFRSRARSKPLVRPQNDPVEVPLRATPQLPHRSVEPVLIETSEVARMLSMSTSWVYREASKLGLKGYKLGRGRNSKVLYKKHEVLKWLEQQEIL
ncbi:helix-turn-helix domain-containing protein [Streptomyces phaeolivaceus]